MTTETMIERVGKDMRQAYADHIGDKIVSWEQAGKPQKASWMVCARAALQALRKPTESMEAAAGHALANAFTDPLDVIFPPEAEFFGLDTTVEGFWDTPVAELMVDDARDVFIATIDAALQEKT